MYQTLGNYVVRPLLHVLFRPERDGWENVPDEGPAILCSNHESIVDPFILGMTTHRVIHYMAKAELFGYPVLKQLMIGSGVFPVERGAADGRAMAHGRELLERGELIGIFPQGTCLPYRIRPYRRGAARLALETGTPIVPVCMIGTERILRPGKPKLGLPKVRIRAAPPIEVERGEPTPDAAAALTARVERTVEELRGEYVPQHLWREGEFRPQTRRLTCARGSKQSEYR